MYKPLFNKVLVEIDDKEAKWGSGSDSIAGEVYREGKVISYGILVPTADYPSLEFEAESGHKKRVLLTALEGSNIMWHEGHEAGTVFEEDGKKYALIYWWDIIGVKE